MPIPKDIFGNFSEKFPLLNRFYGLYEQINGLSKDEQNTLRKSSELAVLETLSLVVEATRQGKETKRQTLILGMRKLETLRVFIDMAKEIRQINENKYGEINEAVLNVTKMIGGWLKALKPAEAK